MITVISATNRPESNTMIVAKEYFQQISQKTKDVKFLSLIDVFEKFELNKMYGFEDKRFNDYIKKYIDAAEKFVFVIPEYNGGFSGASKLFIDSIKPIHFKGKKAALVGVSSGRAGNLRGLDQFTNVLNYLNVTVLPFKNAIAHVDGIIVDELVTDEKTKIFIAKHVDQILNF